MKKYLLVIFLASHTLIFSQNIKFGFKAFPGIGFSRVDITNWDNGSGNMYTFESNPAQFRGGFGVFADYFLHENLAVNVGLNYLLNSSGYKIKKSNDNAFKNSDWERLYAVQYLQLPVAMKFISNDVIDNLRVYISGGAALNAMVGANINSKSNFQPNPTDPIKYYTSELAFLGLDFVGSAGVEYELDNGMKLLVGFSYMHGLLDINARSDDFIKKSGFIVKNSLIALDLGVKF